MPALTGIAPDAKTPPPSLVPARGAPESGAPVRRHGCPLDIREGSAASPPARAGGLGRGRLEGAAVNSALRRLRRPTHQLLARALRHRDPGVLVAVFLRGAGAGAH